VQIHRNHDHNQILLASVHWLQEQKKGGQVLSILIEIGIVFALRNGGVLVKSVADRDENCDVFALRAPYRRHYHEGISRRLISCFYYRSGDVLGAAWEALTIRHSE
jgi:hypothetical protein